MPASPTRLLSLSLVILLASPSPAPARRIDAVPARGDIVVDGVLDEPAWASAPATSGFWQRAPNEGQEPLEETVFRVVTDRESIYVGVRAHDSQPEKIRGLLTRRDQDSASDWILLAIDSRHDRRTSFAFALNPAGVQRDFVLFDDVEEDSRWDAVWEGATSRDDSGWIAEFRIPLAELRFSEGEEGEELVWGLQVGRVLSRAGEETYWSAMPRGEARMVSRFGDLGGLDSVRAPRRIELLPYAVTGVHVADGSTAGPLGDDTAPQLDAGLDFEYGIAGAFTLTGTVNPDFGQIEADPSTVNLSDQENFFAEKRPFFLEGIDLYKFRLTWGDGGDSAEQLFYSRRIGAPPRAPRRAGAVDSETSETTAIYGAAKLSGKDSGWSVGALTAVTASEEARFLMDDDSIMTEVVEPAAMYSLARLRKDLRDGRTTVGAIGTIVHRDPRAATRDSFHEDAFAGGVELSHRFGEDSWMLDAKLVGSHVRGSAEAIAATQTSPRHYYQRPDAEHLELDLERRSLSGFDATTVFGRLGGEHVRFATGAYLRSPGFEINDLGFQYSADNVTNWAWMQYRDDDAGRRLRSWQVNSNTWTDRTFGLEHRNVGGNLNASVTLANLWSGGGGWGVNQNALETSRLRGGPALAGSPSTFGWLWASSDYRERVFGTTNGNVWLRPADDSWSADASLEVGTQLRSNLRLQAGPYLSRRVDALQFVGAYGPEPRYLLGTIDQRTAAMTFRVDYTLTPSLGIQLYAQPFASTGRYRRFIEPSAPRAGSVSARFTELGDADLQMLESDGFQRPDFRFAQLRANTFLRWEYLPGSHAYLIWAHNQTDAGPGAGRTASELAELAQWRGEHRVLLKLSYRWTP